MKRRMHAAFGALALALIAVFMLSSVVAELIGDHELISAVKTAILIGVSVLVLSMAATGGSGRMLAGKARGPAIKTKQKRIAVTAAIGLGVLVPCAIVLQRMAADGSFGTTFYLIQLVEFIGGGVNITLVSLNVRDGMRLTGRIRKKPRVLAGAQGRAE
ncbi:hypothetical protein [Nonomuraea typhae]|uniref:Transmembrane protein n=1 Tax=Nonomuraea typhae TaxID=2603600 RepID=A0ABW7YQE5_9ACTN